MNNVLMRDVWKTEELTHDQNRAWEATMILMGAQCPGYTYIWYQMLSEHKGKLLPMFSHKVPTAATDGHNIVFNPTEYFKLPLAARVFVAAHEVTHNVRNDPFLFERMRQRGGFSYSDGLFIPYDHKLGNIAADYIINAGLIEDGFKPPVNAPGNPFNTLYDTKIATGSDSVLDVIRKIWEQQGGGKKPPKGKGPKRPGDQQGASGGQQGNGEESEESEESDGDSHQEPQNNGGMDDVLAPGATQGHDANEAMAEHNEDRWRTIVSAAEQLHKTKGNMPAYLARLFEGRAHPQVPWQEHIRGWVHKSLGNGGYDWLRPCRRSLDRDMFAPGRSAYGVNWVCIYADTSGSMGAAELRANAAEIVGIFESVAPKRITVFWTDAAIARVDELDSIEELNEVLKAGMPGGGGSDSRPVFDAIRDMAERGMPDAFVGMTDGHIDYPEVEPAYPCIWAMTTENKAPFGETVRVIVDALHD